MPRLLRDAAFELFDCRAIPIVNVGFDLNTYGGGLLDVVASFASGRDGLTQEDVEGWCAGVIALGDNWFFSVNRYPFSARALGNTATPCTRR